MANSAFTPTAFGSSTSSSASTGINYLSAHFAADSLGSVTLSVGDTLASSTRSSPTQWGTSAASAIIAQSNDSTLRGTSNYLVSFTTNGQFVESPLFTLDGSDLGKALQVAFTNSGVSTSDDVQAYIVRYNSSNVLQERIPMAGTASATSPLSARLGTGTAQMNSFFVSGGTATDKYALRIVRNANATAVRLDSFSIGPQSIGIGNPVSTEYAYNTSTTNADDTTSFGDGSAGIQGIFGTTTLTAARKKRVRFATPIQPTDIITIEVRTSSSDYWAPVGLGAGTSGSKVVQHHTENAQDYGMAWTPVNSTDADVYFGRYPNNDSATFGGNASEWSNGAFANYKWRARKDAYSFNTQVADRAVEEYAYNTGSNTTGADTTSFGYGPDGTQFVSQTAALDRTVRFKSPIQPTDSIFIEIWDTNTWFALASYSNAVTLYSSQNGTTYGLSFDQGSVSTDVVVSFGTYRIPTGATFGSAGAAWSGIAGSSNFKWRVRKVSGGAMVGYPVSSQNLVGRTDGVAPSAGYIGERISSATNLSVTSGANTTITSITLTAGVWDVSFAAASAGLASATEFDAGIATATNSQTGWVFADTYASCLMSGGSANVSVSIPGWRTNITSTTTYYLTCNRTGGTSATAYGRITAVRTA